MLIWKFISRVLLLTIPYNSVSGSVKVNVSPNVKRNARGDDRIRSHSRSPFCGPSWDRTKYPLIMSQML